MDFDYDPENLFAKILRGEIPNKTVLETDHALAFHDIAPQAPIHVLVVPKGPYVSLDHFARDASAEEQVGFLSAVSQVCEILGVEAGFRAIANSREHGMQEVPHFHLHILAGRRIGPLVVPQS
ncbi:HIT domain-containing protein [Flavimaricola marinus]|uniref:HIT-like protein HinT n=1 Tax=Flavimaricola marinus TaxID=1819565 RepID=A0A238L9V3_9RHOB|nr:HIT domain-containing protein [Flavimaricola marinus]SMY06204.1 HIT-like protein HinT [Flavimaricola marinus]